jgi:hypothetical protein
MVGMVSLSKEVANMKIHMDQLHEEYAETNRSETSC